MGEVVGGLISGGLGLLGAGEQAGAASDAANISAGASKYAADIQKQIYDQTRTDQTPWREVGGGALNQLAALAGIARPTETYDQIRSRLAPQYTTTSTTQASAPSFGGGTWLQNLANLQLSQIGAPSSSQTTSVNNAALDAAAQVEYEKQLAAAKSAPGFGSAVRDFSMADYQADPGYAFRMSEGEKALERSAAARGGLYSGRAMKDMQRFSQGLASEEYQNAYNRFNNNQSTKFNRLASLAGVGQTANGALAQAGQAYAGSVGNLAMTNAANQGNAALVGGNARASAYQGFGNALGGVNWGNVWNGMGGGKNYFNSANEGVGGLSASYIQGGF